MNERNKKENKAEKLLGFRKVEKRQGLTTLFLVFAFVFGTLPMGVFAGKCESGYQIYKNPVEVTNKADGVTYQKSIEAVPDDHYAFDIAIKVTTQEKIVPINKGADVVLVIDISGSMNEIYDGKTLLQSTKEAAQQFATAFLSASPSSKLGLVTYDNYVDKPSFSQGIYFTSEITTFNTAINEIKTFGGGTFTQGGIRAAQELLSSDQSLNEDKYMIVFSDGDPNYSYNGLTADFITPGDKIIPMGSPPDNFDMSFKITSFGDNIGTVAGGEYPPFGSLGPADHQITTVSQALLAKESDGIDVFSVLFDNQNWFSGDVKRLNRAKFTMTNVASDINQYYQAENIEEMANSFKEIAADIIVKTNSWRITDPMPNEDYIAFDTGASVSINGNHTFTGSSLPTGVTFEGNTLRWNMLDPRQPEPVVVIDPSGKKYVYTLVYRVVIDPDKDPPTDPFSTNGETTLDYYITNEGIHFDPNDPKSYTTVEFEVPQVIDKDSAPKEIFVKAKNMVAYQGGVSISGDYFPSPYYELFIYENGILNPKPLTLEEILALSFTINGDPVTDNYYLYGIPYRAYFMKEGVRYNYLPGDIGTLPTYEEPGVYTIELTTKPVDGSYEEPGATSTGSAGRIEENKTYRLTTNNGDPGILEIRPKDTTTPTTFETVLENGSLPTEAIENPTASTPTGTTYLNSAGIVPGFMYEYTPNITLMKDTIYFEDNANAIAAYISSRGEETISSRTYWIKSYMDLVDRANGNILVSALTSEGTSQEVTVFYPYPEGTSKDNAKGFTIIQFPNMKRTPGDTTDGAALISPTLEENGIRFTVSAFGAFAIGYNPPPVYFNITKDITTGATEKEQFVFKIEKLPDPIPEPVTKNVAASADIFYTVIDIRQDTEIGAETIKVLQPGLYKITELSSNWRYELTEVSPMVERAEETSTIITVSPGDINPGAENLPNATFTNNKEKTRGLGAKDSTKNKMYPMPN